MSPASIALRPLEDHNFVVGYPGIPSDTHGRPSASVSGMVEIRGIHNITDNIKAKWVHVELRKIETIKWKGVTHRFEEGVGPRPTTLWSASDPDGYGILVAQDFPFAVRVPESIPPSLEGENGVGVSYELVATACVKGKGAFLRRSKPTIITSTIPIVIQKHELHSTWPIYAVQDTLKHRQNGFDLSVGLTQRCFGPGDRITLTANLESITAGLCTHTVLQDFEVTLKESITFIQGSNNLTPSATRETNIAFSKIPINVGIEANRSYSTEVACVVPPDHTLATLNTLSSRHINIAYTLSIKAVLNKTSIGLEFPVIISNIERHESTRMVTNIGPIPALGSPMDRRQSHISHSSESGSDQIDQHHIRRQSVSREHSQDAHVFDQPTLSAESLVPGSTARTRRPLPLPSNPERDSFLSTSSILTRVRRSSTQSTPNQSRESQFKILGPRPRTSGAPMLVVRRSLPAVLPLKINRPHMPGIQASRRTWPSAQNVQHLQTGLPLAMNSLLTTPIAANGYSNDRFTTLMCPVHLETSSCASSTPTISPSQVRTYSDSGNQTIDINEPDSSPSTSPSDTNPTEDQLSEDLPLQTSSLKLDRSTKQEEAPIQIISRLEEDPEASESSQHFDTSYSRMSGDIDYEYSTDDDDIYDDPSPEYSSSDDLSLSTLSRCSSAWTNQCPSTSRGTVAISSASKSVSSTGRNTPYDTGYEPSNPSMYGSSIGSLSVSTLYPYERPSAPTPAHRWTTGGLRFDPYDDETENDENPPDYLTSIFMPYY